MITVAICDDNKYERNEIANICENFLVDQEFKIFCFSDGEELFEKYLEIDILFLDIEMSGMSGIQVKDRLNKLNIDIKIIFITSHREMMQEAFGEHVCDFIFKPIQRKSIEASLQKVMANIIGEDNIIFELTHGTVQIRKSDIVYIESYKHYCNVYTKSTRQITVRANISQLAVLLDNEDFCHCHRSYIINLLYIKSISKNIELITGDLIPISRKLKKVLIEQFYDFIQRQVI